MSLKTFVLVVLDGWGIGRHDESNPIYVVKPPTLERLAREYPLTSLQASGLGVGLPWGEVGNSEVGHMTLGAGKILYQYYPKIMMAIEDGSFFTTPALREAFDHAIKNNGAVNFAGLLTKANVHASIDHLNALIRGAKEAGVTNINLHLFTDGKDSPPHTLQIFLKEIPMEYLASLIGRYYAMDRNGNWRLTEVAYQTMIGQAGQVVPDPLPSIEAIYQQGMTEEYLPPLRFTPNGQVKKVSDGDALIFFNYREDSIRQLAASFIKKGFNNFATIPFQNLYVATMSHYEDDFDVPVLCPADTVEMPIGKVFSDLNMTQLRIAETYKYAHVTYFFNGLREPPFPGEFRTVIPSASGSRPEDHPEMMAAAITDRIIEAIKSRGFNFILVNYANGDTMGHTANYDAGLEAVRVIDRELARVVAAAEETGTGMIITSDHGNLEEMINPITAQPESQHDPSPVPLYLVVPGYKGRKFANTDSYERETLGSLADVAPTILALMGIKKPPEMSGSSLLDNLI